MRHENVRIYRHPKVCNALNFWQIFINSAKCEYQKINWEERQWHRQDSINWEIRQRHRQDSINWEVRQRHRQDSIPIDIYALLLNLIKAFSAWFEFLFFTKRLLQEKLIKLWPWVVFEFAVQENIHRVNFTRMLLFSDP